MKMTSLIVNTPEGYSGRVLTSAADFVFRYDAEAMHGEAVSLIDARFAKPICKAR
ncbi:hypothetical protein J2Y86_004245 [Pseudomonas migulae]|jgi:serine/threonine-protein kinase HipA|uniref:hypothetical protein n=1 Tax=Pseudomonas migulae TaxID=78543 RepID=UPI00209F7A6D|nr:hypothetical protein [Pseudomonas migulae]MCP1499538.1 hypothetical protein [Pseudomonas migulae]